MSELLFECYHIPQVSYGTDAMFSFYKNFTNSGMHFWGDLQLNLTHGLIDILLKPAIVKSTFEVDTGQPL